MPTVAQLDRLKALTELLTPLTNVQRGELIRAEDWNNVVGALIEVARTVLAEDVEVKQVPPHEHPDQVKATWLDPALRSIVERGPLSDPAADSRLGEVERRTARLSGMLDKFQIETNEVRSRVAEVSTRDLARQAEITSVRRTVEGIDARRDDITALRNTLASVQRDVHTAVSVGARLQIDGQPVDMAEVDRRIRAVEELRDRLRTPAGGLLDAAQLENRLTELTNALVTQQQLDEALRTRQTEIPQGVLEGLRDSVSASVRENIEGLIATRFQDLRNETNTRLGEIDGRVSRAVADAQPGITQSTLAAVRPEISGTVQRAIQEATAAGDRRRDEAIASVRADLDAGLGDLRASIRTEISTELNTQLPAQLDAMRRDVAAVRDQTASFEQRLSAQETGLQAASTRVEQVAREAATGRGDLQRSLLTEMQSRLDTLSANVDRRFTEIGRASQDQINAAMTALQRTLTDQIQRAAADAAAAEARNLLTRVRGEMAAVAQDQVAALKAGLPAVVNSAVSDAMRAVPGIVSQEVRRATANLGELVRAEFDAFQPQLRALIGSEVNRRITARPGLTGPLSPGGTILDR